MPSGKAQSFISAKVLKTGVFPFCHREREVLFGLDFDVAFRNHLRNDQNQKQPVDDRAT